MAFAVGATLGPYIHILDWGGLKGGLSEANMDALLDIAKEHGCGEIVLERNLGGGVSTKLLQSHASKRGDKVGISDANSVGQKERRIIDCVGPMLRRHRLVLHKGAVDRDLDTIKVYPMDRRNMYSGMFQLDAITTDRGCLNKDDRIDVLEQLCRKLGSTLVQDEHKAAEVRRHAEALEFFKNPMGIPNNNNPRNRRGGNGQAFLRRRF